jgi:hypothetical protein
MPVVAAACDEWRPRAVADVIAKAVASVAQ